MEYSLWINGEWQESQGGGKSEINNPATGETIAHVVDGSNEDVDRAVQAAKTAFHDGRWSKKTPSQRSLALWRLADLLEKKSEEFARVETENTGKPYQMMSLEGDIPFSIDNLRFFAGAARDIHGFHAGEFAEGYTSIFRREPVGAVGQITPWNYPLMTAVWKIGPALAAGCTAVLKPAPTTPLTTLMLAELTAEAGVPAGVINIVTGGNATGQAIVEHPGLRMISFTGSTATGKQVMQTASSTLKRVHLELGGKAPFIVFDDADIELVASKASLAATFNSGQDCTAATRLYVDSSRFESVKEAVVEAMKRVKVGDPLDADVDMGPLISNEQLVRVSGFVERAREAGAEIITGGSRSTQFPDGHYFDPTVIVNAKQDSEIVQNEVFGPVMTINSFSNQNEATELGNDVLHGLAASVFTNDVERALIISRDLEFGTVWINDHLPVASEAPHGGFKQSGFGKDLSSEAMGDYQITKHVMVSTGN